MEQQPLDSFRHCEARSDVAIHVVVRPPMDCFRHCEERSAAAIHVVVRPPMDCFVPRNDNAGAQ
jgi:hypothetical protein